MIKRLFDIFFSLIMLVILSPVFLFIIVAVIVDSRGGAFFGQTRIGKNEEPFKLWKFRTMRPDSENKGQLTIGARDSRITRVGFVLRKYKIDELPQLWNVFVGEMSMVGPRPEVPRYVAMYNQEQKGVLSVKPGITDYASLLYFEESELLAKSANPEQTYISEVMPAKLRLNLEYIRSNSFGGDLRIIAQTVKRMFS